ncbi:MAG: polysaccharide biosynthesis C-terminal domain-containing protein [Oscillospiraceae bacterium]|jgi:O-antigen/teichoic acid export membrane protein|nr:polysaccharide biosynthesis C-terminal domain-containing protein [Oscillospiraceae bacterium]
MKHSILSRVTGNDYTFTVLTKVVSLAVGLVATSFSSRYLGPALMGDYAYINTLLTTVAVVANFGLYQPYPYYKRQGEADALGKFLRIFSLQYLAYTALGLLLAVALGSFTLAAVCLIAPVQVLANQLSFMIMVEDVKYKNVVFLTARFTNTAIITLAFLTLAPSLIVALGLVVVGDVITVVMALRRLGRVGNPLKADMGFLRKIFGFGLVSMLTTLLLTLNYRLDIAMLTWMGVGSAQVGYYQAGIGLAEYGWIISDAFREVLFSRTVRADAVQNVTFSLKINFYITLAIVAGIVLLGKPAILILRGAAFLPSYRVTVILLTGVLSMSYFKLIGTLLLAEGRKGPYLAMLSASVAINAAANWLTIPVWGIDGAAVASVLSYTVAGAAFLVYFLRVYRVPAAQVFVFRRQELAALRARLRRR